MPSRRSRCGRATVSWAVCVPCQGSPTRPRQAEADSYSSGAPGNGGDHEGEWSMDQNTSHGQRNIEEPQLAVTENMAGVEERVQQMVEGLKSTVHRAMERFKQMQETVDGAKTAVD